MAMMQDDFVDEEIKTMFKVSRRLQTSFSDVKTLTFRYLLKAKKIKQRKKIARQERKQRERMEEIQRRKRQKTEQRKQKKQKQKHQKQKIQKQKELQKVKNQYMPQAEPKKPEGRSIASIIRPTKPKKDQIAKPVPQPAPSVPGSKPEQKKKSEKSAPKPTAQEQKPKAKQKEKDKKKTAVAEGKAVQQEQKITKKPVQPQSPYFRFLRDKKAQIKASSPNMTMQQISRIMRNIWDKLTDMQKRPYVVGYEKAKAEFERQMYQYYQNRATGGKEGGKKGEGKKGKEGKNEEYDFIDEFGDI